MVSSKYELLNQIANKVQTLDNPIKLKILAMLVEEGSKSVTDISKDMNLNFSTAHKYLEQLEAAGLVTSKQVSENRLKRIFSIGDFNLDISPHGLSNFLNDKKTEPKKTFEVLNERGEEVQFDEARFSQKYIKRGLPSTTIKNVLDKVIEHAYDGITLLELRELVRQELAKKLETITNVMEMIEESEIRGRTYYNLLKLNHPEALKMHMDGDIFIQNLGEPKLLNFVHDLRGISAHGVKGKVPKNSEEFLDQTHYVAELLCDSGCKKQSFDSFNYFLAPLVSKKPGELDAQLLKFLNYLENLDGEFILCLDLGLARFFKVITSSYFHVSSLPGASYKEYASTARQIQTSLLRIFEKNKFRKSKLLIKIWDWKEFLPHSAINYVADMTHDWQSINAGYVGEFARLDSSWQGWTRTVRAGEVQNIAINASKLQKQFKSKGEFLNNLQELARACVRALISMSELNLSEALKPRKTILPSAQREKWDYVPIEDCQHTISFFGLNGDVAKKILPEINKLIKSELHGMSLRIAVREHIDPAVVSRFLNINKSKHSIALPSELHKFLSGGHCLYLGRDEANALQKLDFGLLKLMDYK